MTIAWANDPEVQSLIDADVWDGLIDGMDDYIDELEAGL